MSEPEQQSKEPTKPRPVFFSDGGGLGMLFAIAILVAGIFSMSQSSLTSSISNAFGAVVEVLKKQNP